MGIGPAVVPKISLPRRKASYIALFDPLRDTDHSLPGYRADPDHPDLRFGAVELGVIGLRIQRGSGLPVCGRRWFTAKDLFEGLDLVVTTLVLRGRFRNVAVECLDWRVVPVLLTQVGHRSVQLLRILIADSRQIGY
ncbi:hypothetical protein GBP88_21465 [Mycobacterium avium subsp. hominissuis]|uniref:Uncharacterized protein n=3 Tax=Mycobacterium avium complex (MAC) TaxID=120793 RepID=A0ABX3TFW5_9MYCO|nr:hypothetical protein BS641_26370 [Mycobacterium avium subsp. hominissuis]ORA57179.1 hypothetical protein BST19_04235 [Mycobacterium bouchedurhonense]ORB77657.1 hypothetical protein BST46_23360 [Mycobacterium timonense]PAZ99056.1 hypothetical protein CKJ74_23820 [Mycobacterium avium]AXO25826.1 hypothetical protein DFS55_24490 [Mycobacterium avium subsp. hominissuis]